MYNNSSNKAYDNEYLERLKKELNSLKIEPSKKIDSDLEEIDEIVSEIPKIDYNNVISGLAKLKINGVSESAEVIDELTENRKSKEDDNLEINVIEENNLIDGIDFIIPEFDKNLILDEQANGSPDIDKVLNDLREKNEKKQFNRNNWMDDLIIEDKIKKEHNKIIEDNTLFKDDIIIESDVV